MTKKKNTKTTDKVNLQWLTQRGYTVEQAATLLSVDPATLRDALSKDCQYSALIEGLMRLPNLNKGDFVPRVVPLDALPMHKPFHQDYNLTKEKWAALVRVSDYEQMWPMAEELFYALNKVSAGSDRRGLVTVQEFCTFWLGDCLFAGTCRAELWADYNRWKKATANVPQEYCKRYAETRMAGFFRMNAQRLLNGALEGAAHADLWYFLDVAAKENTKVNPFPMT